MQGTWNSWQGTFSTVVSYACYLEFIARYLFDCSFQCKVPQIHCKVPFWDARYLQMNGKVPWWVWKMGTLKSTSNWLSLSFGIGSEKWEPWQVSQIDGLGTLQLLVGTLHCCRGSLHWLPLSFGIGSEKWEPWKVAQIDGLGTLHLLVCPSPWFNDN